MPQGPGSVLGPLGSVLGICRGRPGAHFDRSETFMEVTLGRRIYRERNINIYKRFIKIYIKNNEKLNISLFEGSRNWSAHPSNWMQNFRDSPKAAQVEPRRPSDGALRRLQGTPKSIFLRNFDPLNLNNHCKFTRKIAAFSFYVILT